MKQGRIKQAVILVLAIGAFFYWRSLTHWSIANAPPRSGPIIALGDSLTEGVGAGESDNYPAQLSKIIGMPIVNKGVSGETSLQAFNRLERDVLSAQPGIVIVLLGGNDLLQRVPEDQTLETLDRIVTPCTEQGAMVVLVGIDRPSILGGSFNKGIKSLARKRHCVFVSDVLDGIMGRPALMSDQIHPNSDGYKLVAEKIAAAMTPHMR